VRVAYAPESNYMHGKLPLAAVADAGGLGLVVYAHAASSAALAVVKTELAAALAQWRFEVTTNVDGVLTTYESIAPAIPFWGQVDSGMVAAHMAKCSVTIPVNPPTGA